MIADEKYKLLVSNLEKEIKNSDTDLLNKYPVEPYIAFIDQYPKYVGYKYRSDDVKRYSESIAGNTDSDVLEIYHKLVLIQLIYRSQSRIDKLFFPDDIKRYYIEDFDRIISQIECDNGAKSYYLYTNDRFFKDLSICCLRLFPIGARKYELVKFPIKRLIGKGWVQLFKVMFFLILETRGIAPFLTGHYDSEDPNFMKAFNVEGFITAYRMIADVMKLNPEIKGYFGINWLNDPQIERISPHLSYIRYMNVACGCKYFCLGTNSSSIKNATVKSPTRRKLYQEGKYLPHNYGFVYSRKRIIAWADDLKWHW